MSKRGLLIGLTAVLLAAVGLAALSLIAGTFPVLRAPDPVSIVIDAGHGGRDPGVVVDGIRESAVNLEIAMRVEELLASDPSINVVMTRRTDVYASHEKRVDTADNSNAVLYVSIQANACNYPDVTGIETWVDDDQAPGSESWSLAELIQNSLVSGTESRDRGVRSMGLYLGGLSCPAVLVETGFLTSQDEREKLLSEEYQQLVAQCIAEGILAMLE